MTGLRGAARNPTALTALRPAGSCNSAISVYPASCSLHRAKADGGYFFDFPMHVFKRERPLFSGRGRLEPMTRRFVPDSTGM